MDITPRMTDHSMLCRAAAVGSMVLLKNVNNTLPLRSEGTEPLPVAVFGAGQVYTACAAVGMQSWRTVNILDGLRSCPDLRPDGLLAHKYTAWCLEHPLGDEMPLGSLSMEEFAQENAAAIAVITRKTDDKTVTLTADERDMLTRVAGAFPRAVLVVNAPGYVDLEDFARSFPAVLFLGIGGQEAGHALADVLTGRAVPSGKLAFSWPLSASQWDRANEKTDRFCGYRYFDAFGEEVLWPFGHGLGYGASALSAISMGLEGYEVVVTAEAENVGETWPVQETVQVYASTPDQAAPAWELAAFCKTRLLEPGEKQTVTLRFPVTQLAGYRPESRAWVLDGGDYDIRVGTASRSTYIAGSLRLNRSNLVQAGAQLPLAEDQSRVRGSAWTYPEEAEELAAARKRAIRFSDRNLPRKAQKKGRAFTGCRSDGKMHTYGELQKGWCSAFQLVAAMDNDSLRAFVCDFGFAPAQVPGALGASRALPEYELPAKTIAAGGTGLQLQKELRDEETDKVTKRQNVTAFPAASLLACAFDPELVRAVGAAISREGREYGVSLWLAPGADVRRAPDQENAFDTWSEDPLVCGLCAAALAKGAKAHCRPVLRSVSAQSGELDQRTYRDLCAKPFAMAAKAYPALLLPDVQLCGEFCGEDSALVRALVVEHQFAGMFLADRERYNAAPDRILLEKSALRILSALF